MDASTKEIPSLAASQVRGFTARNKPLLACPFYKWDAHKYHDCLRYGLRRIKDVKQHVYRRHTKPDLYCAVCYQVFSSADARDAHVRGMDCSQRLDIISMASRISSDRTLG